MTDDGHRRAFPNSREAALARVAAGQVSWGRTLAVLASRTVWFVLAQGLIALGLLLGGVERPWEASIAWWPWAFIVSNLVSVGVLFGLARSEGLRLVDLYRGAPHPLRRDLPVLLLGMLLSGPVAWLPNVLVAEGLFGDPLVPVRMMFRPLPDWALVPSVVLFPLSVAFAELPTYLGYGVPRVEALSGRPWLAVALPACGLSVQHVAAPLIFDGPYLLWRAVMFLPFALFLAAGIRWRPRLLPYWMGVHGLMDLGTMGTLWMAAHGGL